MNNTLSIAKIKRHGMYAIEDALIHGPVQIVNRNNTVAVMLSQEQYNCLNQQISQDRSSALPTGNLSAIDWLLSQPEGTRSNEEIDAWIREGRYN